MLLKSMPGKKHKAFVYILIGIFLVSFVGTAVIGVPTYVFALSAGGIKGTIASIVISLMLQTGVAPTNQNWINQLNTAYGVESSIGTIENMVSNGLLTSNGETLVDTGLSVAIEAEPAYTNLGLDAIFTTTSDDAVAGAVSVASGGANLANTAINVGTLGTIGAFAGAAAVGVGLGVLSAHMISNFKDIVKYGLPMDIGPELIKNIQPGVNIYYTTRQSNVTQYTTAYYCSSGIVAGGYFTGVNDGFNTKIYNSSPETESYYTKSYRNGNLNSEGSVRTLLSGNSVDGPIIGNQSGNTFISSNISRFSTETDVTNYFNGVSNGTESPKLPVSPDIVTPQGNAVYEDDNGVESIKGVSPQVENGEDMTPVSEDEYQDYVDQANENTRNDETGEEDQGQDFTNFITPYITEDPNYTPDPEPDPPRPVEPTQPVIPDKPVDPANQEKALGMATPGLKDIFPFCIPWDIASLFTIFKSDTRKAPYVKFTFLDGNEIEIDLSKFDSAASLLRTLELIFFVMGLMIATRKLLGIGG